MADTGGQPVWRPPAPYGFPESVQSTGMIVAPLLAGFTIALAGLVVDTSNLGIRYRNEALLVLTAAVAALLAAIQCAASARRYLVVPDEIDAWWPDATTPIDKQEREQLAYLQAEQLAHSILHDRWADRSRFAYHVGIVLVLTGLAVVLVPPASKSGLSPTRQAAIGLAGLAAACEVLWILCASIVSWRPGARWSRFGRVVRRLVPSYEDQLRDAHMCVGVRQLADEIAASRVDRTVARKLTNGLDGALSDMESGARAAAQAKLQNVANLISFEKERGKLNDTKAARWGTTVQSLMQE